MTSHPTNLARLSPRRRQRPGFTLIEVLATLLLLAIVLPVIMNAISLATSAGSVAKQRSDAYTLCESKLDELVATGQWQYGNLGGDFSPDFPRYRWTASMADWTDPTVQELDVHVLWTMRGREQDLMLSTLVYPNANPSDPGAAGASTSGSGIAGNSAGTSGATGGKRATQ